MALEHFLGKSVEDASRLMFENALFYIDDLGWMGLRAFAFYLPSVVPYLESQDSREDSGAIDSLVSIITMRIDEEPDAVGVAGAPVLEVVALIDRSFPKFDVDEVIYRNLRRDVTTLLERLVRS
ncbi:MAG: hypothetical protein AAF726_20135 [Planctomycetota bacterium]